MYSSLMSYTTSRLITFYHYIYPFWGVGALLFTLLIIQLCQANITMLPTARLMHTGGISSSINVYISCVIVLDSIWLFVIIFMSTDSKCQITASINQPIEYNYNLINTNIYKGMSYEIFNIKIVFSRIYFIEINKIE